MFLVGRATDKRLDQHKRLQATEALTATHEDQERRVSPYCRTKNLMTMQSTLSYHRAELSVVCSSTSIGSVILSEQIALTTSGSTANITLSAGCALACYVTNSHPYLYALMTRWSEALFAPSQVGASFVDGT